MSLYRLQSYGAKYRIHHKKDPDIFGLIFDDPYQAWEYERLANAYIDSTLTRGQRIELEWLIKKWVESDRKEDLKTLISIKKLEFD